MKLIKCYNLNILCRGVKNIKKVLLVIFLVSTLLLTGCNLNESIENDKLPTDIENSQQQEEIDDNQNMNNENKENLENEESNVKISKEIAKSYTEIVNSIENLEPGEYEYKLAYINDDEVPELVIDKADYYTGIITSLEDKLYIVRGENFISTNETGITNNSIDDLESLHLLLYGTSRRSGYDYVTKGNILSCIIPSIASSVIEIYTLDGNVLRMESELSTQLFDGSLAVNEDEIDENVDIDSLETKYYLNGSEISEEEYRGKIDRLSNSESLQGDMYNASEFIEYLKLNAN